MPGQGTASGQGVLEADGQECFGNAPEGPVVIHTLLPDQYLPPASTRLALPQRRLMMAVLQTVIDDVHGSAHRRAAGHEGPADRREVERARAYIASTDRSWPFSFENVCEAIGIDSGSLRRALERLLPAPLDV